MSIQNKTNNVLYKTLTIKRKQPINLIEDGMPSFIKNVNTNFKEVFLYNYKKVNITPEGHIFNNLSIDKDLLIYPKHKKIYNFLYVASTLIKRKKIKLDSNETYLICFDYWSNGIFHWMCDALPRLEAVKELAKQCVFILPKFFEYTYIHETLKAFEFKAIYLIEDTTYLYCANLMVPQQITTSGQMRPENILSLRHTLLNHFKPKFTGNIKQPNIYISRNKAKYRKVINEQELLPLLKKYNFEIIFFEDYSVCQQIELCYHAKNIVSIHGANLTNVIFMQPNCNVLEFRKKDDVDNNYFYELADSVNCNYYYLNCEFEDPKPHTNTFSLYVDADKFETYLKTLTSV